MKRSQIALLSVVAALAGAVVAGVVSARIALAPESMAFADREPVPAGLEIHGVREIAVAGSWQVNLRRGDEWRMDLSYPDALADSVEVRVVGERLRLDVRSESWWDEPDILPFADIVMPELEEVDVNGSALLDLKGFRGQHLDIDVAGASRLVGHDGHFDALELSVAGASHIDLKGVTVRDANVDLAGASEVTLTMHGGSLSGSIAGTGSVEYYGEVPAERIQIAGFARVERMR